jgi:hypothetical protein
VFAAFLISLALATVPQPQALLTLEIRVFNGPDEVTRHSRVTVHRAGERGTPVGRVDPGAPGHVQVPAGIYDAQAVHEVSGRVQDIRWAHRLVVMPYPDEAGHHLEVINFQKDYGALQLRAKPGAQLEEDIEVYGTGQRDAPARAYTGPGYRLFVLRAGTYDLQVRRGVRMTWYNDLDVPIDRTRLWIIP